MKQRFQVLGCMVSVMLLTTLLWIWARRPDSFAGLLLPDGFHFSSPETVVDIMAPTVYTDHKYAWIDENQKATHALFSCIPRGDCAQNQTKVVLIASYPFIDLMQRGYVGGEAIWALSTITALNNMGYSVLYAHKTESAIELYQLYANLITMVIVNVDQMDWCIREEVCVRSPANPAGIPVWKLFAFHFWSGHVHPLSPKWTFSPEDYKTNNYLGYSIEPQCSRHPFVPHSERPRQVYILAKFLKFFNPKERAWAPELFDAAANEAGVSFVMSSRNSSETKLTPGDLSPSIENIGPVSQDEFYNVLSRSVALVGVGNPIISPTPYDALCLGIPFVNPIFSWDKQDPTNRTRWETQHNYLKELSAPYVYNVFVGDHDGFVNAIKSAVDNPIESYVLERMRMASVEYRLGKMLEYDWRAEAAELLEERKAGRVPGKLFEL
ncbi:hypothetical protein C8R45DRAFT_997083 [Mycena sanguinolenta]|nr:hypothetical protein C8R45DRAFT_997083 [Mycena sanguinolenta]